MKALIGLFVVAVGGIGGFSFLDGASEKQNSVLEYPLPRGEEREKKLTFGLFVTPNPEQNPIDPPERFTGFHTALDLEIFPEEENVDVPVLAACDGTILQAEVLEGYGGVIIQSCTLEGEEATVLYGHLDFNRFEKKAGDEVTTGTQIGFLGDEKSPESGNTRKHLHFGVHKGSEIEVRGYVQSESELEGYIDPRSLLPAN